MKRKKDAAAEITHTAAEIKDVIIEKLGPLLEQAQGVVEGAGEQIAPLAHDAKVKGAKVASNAMDKAHPMLDDAIDRVAPAVDDAREKLQKDLLPKLSDMLKNAAEDVAPSKKELKQLHKQAKKEGGKALATFQKKYGVEPKRSTGKKVGAFAAIAAVVGAAVVLLRKYLGQTDESGWAAHEPSTAYTPKKEEAADVVSAKVEDARRAFAEGVETVKDTAAEAGDKIADKADDVAERAETIADDAAAKSDVAADVATDADAEPRTYGEGAYVGNEPPEQFRIKGNERSMKYHVEGSEGFERTIPEVWFDSEETAERYGFTRAQR